MQHRDPSSSSGDRAKRRGLFGGRAEPTAPPPLTTGLTPSAAERAELVLGAYQEMIQEQLDEGLRAIAHSANSLMHEIAGEVWRSAGGDKEAVASTILQELSRDQAIRALIAHSDERFQALAARTGRLEDTMNMLAETVRGAREQISRSADALADSGGGSPLGVGQFRAQLDEVSRQVAGAFQTLADRDQEIVDTLQVRIREHGELISQETARISQAMEAYVQQGVEAMGRLAGSADSSMQAMSAHDEENEERVLRSVDERLSELAEQLQLLYDRTGIAMTSLHESVSFLGDRVGVEARERLEEMSHAFETRVIGLANLVRSDSEALRKEMVRTAEAHDESIARMLDERLTLVTDTMAESVARTIQTKLDESMTTLSERTDEQTRLIEARTAEQTQLIDARTGEQIQLIDARTGETVSAIDRNLIRMVDALEEHFERLGTGVSERAATAAELAIGARFDDVLARLHEAASVIEREGTQTRGAIDATRSHMDETRSALDTRFVALAKLVRSDSETLAGQIVTDQDVTKQALRAVKELQASLPAEVIQMVEQRFGSLAESIERSNEMLAARIDRMADTIGQRQNDDIQVVIDRMGDAMHALASLGKSGAPSDSEPRIEID
ncbi:MAG: hypothetical protein WB297_15100 [Actinomycetota bacterium]